METMKLEIHQEDPQWKMWRCYCHRAFVLGVFVSFGIALFGCSAGSGGSSDGGAKVVPIGDGGNGVAVRLSDAPGNLAWFARADVDIAEINVAISDGGGDHWMKISNGPATVNLLDLRGGLSLLLGRLDLPNGNISQIRLVLTGASLTLNDGRVFPLKVPSGEESGLKIFISPALEVRTGVAAELMLDFDVSRSFVAFGNPRTMADVRGFLFKPVVRVGNSTTQGALSGQVYGDNCSPGNAADDTPVSMATVEVYDVQGNLVCANSTINNGNFAVYGLDAGTYQVKFIADGYSAGETPMTQVYVGNTSISSRVTLAKQNCGGATDTSTSSGTATASATDSGSATVTDTSVATSSDTSVATGSDTSVSTATDTGVATASDTSVASSSDTSTSTDTGGVTFTVSSTDTATSSTTASATDTATQMYPWSIFGFDATTNSTAMGVIWQTDMPTTGVLRVGLSPNDLSLIVININQADTTQILTVNGLVPNTTYYLQVTATDANGLSQDSVIISKTTKP